MSTNGYIDTSVSKGKRTFDIAVSVVGLLLALPLIPIISAAILVNSPGPVLFRQLRIGQMHPNWTELFYMYKFRTMYVDAEARTGPVWATKNDPRITGVGRFLRKTRLDEIPQLVNVLRGEMSLIGPRPERPGICNNLEQEIPFYAERTYGVRPGITGLAQVYQGYDETIDDVRRKVSFDHSYALALTKLSSWIAIDLKVMFRTVAVVALGRGQ